MKRVINEFKISKVDNKYKLNKVVNEFKITSQNVIVKTNTVIDNSAPHSHNVDDITITAFQLSELDSILYS